MYRLSKKIMKGLCRLKKNVRDMLLQHFGPETKLGKLKILLKN